MSKRGNKHKINVSVSALTITMVIVGFILIAVVHIPMGNWDQITWVIAGKKIGETIGNTLFSAGLVSVVVEISTISEVVKKALSSIVQGKFPFEKLSKERLEEVGKQIACLRLNDQFLKEKDIEDSPYMLEPELLNLSKGLYYEYHKAQFVINQESNTGMFVKKVEFDYEIVNKFKLENSASLTISLICNKDNLTKDDVKKNFKIKLFKIEESDEIRVTKQRCNEKNLTDVADQYWSVSDAERGENSLYKYQIDFKYPLNPNKLANRILLVYEYKIPNTDIVQSYKLNYPSKQLKHEIVMETDGWEITGDAYTAFYYPAIYAKDYSVVQTVPKNIRVEFNEWAVPGAGYMTTFLKK